MSKVRVAAVADELQVLPVGDQAVGQGEVLEEDLVARLLVVVAKPRFIVPDARRFRPGIST